MDDDDAGLGEMNNLWFRNEEASFFFFFFGGGLLIVIDVYSMYKLPLIDGHEVIVIVIVITITS